MPERESLPRPSARVVIDFAGATILQHPRASYAVHVDREPTDLTLTIKNARLQSGGTFPMPLPGRGWWRRFYWALAWSLGRRGR